MACITAPLFPCVLFPRRISGCVGVLLANDTLAEWLRRRPAKPVGSARVGSNPTGVEFLGVRI